MTRARNGELTLIAKADDATLRYLHSAYDPTHESLRKREYLFQRDADAYFFLGLGLGYELLALLSVDNSQRPIYVLEYSKEIFTFFKETPHARQLLENARITFVIAPDEPALNALLLLLKQKKLALVKLDHSNFLFPDLYRAVRNRLGNGEKAKSFKILFLVGKGIVAPYIVNDLATAFASLGHTVSFCALSEADNVPVIPGDVPDIILSLDYAGMQYDWVKRTSAQKVTWFVDNPFYFIEKVDPTVLVFSWDKSYIPMLESAGFSNVYYMPLATNPLVFYPGEVHERFKVDVSFIGSVGCEDTIKDFLLDSYENNKDVCFDDYAAKLYSARMCGDLRPPALIFELPYAKLSQKKQRAIDFYCDHVVGSRLRQEVIRTLSQFDYRIYGNQGARECCTSSACYGGSLDYQAEVPHLYRSSKININVTRPQLITAVNQRVFDIAACNGFFLTDDRDDLRTFFPELYDSIIFTSPENLKKKICYYLDHDLERQDIARSLHHVVNKEHTYVKRVNTMLEIFREIST